MTEQRDDWVKPRSHGTKLDLSEKAYILRKLREGASVSDVARHLKCSSRVVSKWYSYFRVGGAIDGSIPSNKVTLTDNSHYSVLKLCYANECYEERVGGAFCARHAAQPPQNPRQVARRA